MAATKVWGFNEEGFKRVTEATRRILRTPTTGSQRRRQTPVIGGGGAGCDSQNTIWDITIFGNPSGGTFVLNVTVNGVTEPITFGWNDSAATFKTNLATHSEISSFDIDVTGGNLPNVTIRVEFIVTYANTYMLTPTASFASLTGATGRGIICAMAQKGHA